MSWLGSVGLGFAAAFLSAIAAGWFAAFRSSRLGESREDIGCRTSLYVIPAFAAGLLLGILIGRLSHGGLFVGFTIASCIIVAATAVAAVLDRAFGWAPNKIDRENVVLEVEVKMPLSWTPEIVHDPKTSTCTVSPNGDRRSGEIDRYRQERGEDGRWVVPCWFELRSIYRSRNLTMAIGEDAGEFRSTLSFWITLPPEPYTEKDQCWTPWIEESEHYDFRFRITLESKFMARHEVSRAARRAEEWRRWALLDRQAPLDCWLSPFQPGTDVREGDAPPGASDALQILVHERTSEFALILGSPDRELVRGAVFALSVVTTIPASLTPALIEAGTQVASFAASARESAPGGRQDKAEQIAWEFFERWTQAIQAASPPRDNARYRALMDEIQKASGPRHSFLPTDLPSRLVRRIEKIKARL